MATPQTPPNSDASRPCIACQSAIPLLATKCSVCSSDQRTWVRRLQLLGALGAGITLVASGITYVVSTGGRVLRESRPPKVGVVSFSLLGEQTFGNFGPQGIYLSHLIASGSVLETEEPDALKVFWDQRVVPINQAIDAGAFATSRDTAAEASSDLSPVLEFDEVAWRRKLQQSRMAGRCLSVTYYSSQDPKLLLLQKNFGEALRTFKATGELVYATGKQGTWRTERVPLTGLFLHRHDEACDQWLGTPQRSFTRDEW